MQNCRMFNLVSFVLNFLVFQISMSATSHHVLMEEYVSTTSAHLSVTVLKAGRVTLALMVSVGYRCQDKVYCNLPEFWDTQK